MVIFVYPVMVKSLFVFLLFIQSLCLQAKDTTLVFYHKTFKSQVVVKSPAGISKGTILLLHGYNLPSMEWCQKTTLCDIALQKGYTLVIPDFGKSTYQEKFYPQTASTFRQYPTRKWMRDTVITQLQQQLKLLLPGQNNYVLGLSTGARGAALLALDLPQVFKACACLSGDYDQAKLPQEKIYHNYYGAFSTYKHIWQTDDNVHALVNRWQTPVYLAHGQLDKICPVSQTIKFNALLTKTHPQLTVVCHIVQNQQHNYAFWGSQTQGVLDFFARFS